MPEPANKSVTPAMVQQLGEALGLAIDETRAAELAPQLQALREGLEAMNELPLEGVEPSINSRPGSVTP